MQNPIHFLILSGDIIPILRTYQALIGAKDITIREFAMTEANNCDSSDIAIFRNWGLDPQVKYVVTKISSLSFLFYILHHF